MVYYSQYAHVATKVILIGQNGLSNLGVLYANLIHLKYTKWANKCILYDKNQIVCPW